MKTNVIAEMKKKCEKKKKLQQYQKIEAKRRGRKKKKEEKQLKTWVIGLAEMRKWSGKKITNSIILRNFCKIKEHEFLAQPS